ncbi:PE family protein [Mycobacterium bourgelatii]|uniref:PE family protein n=1 Tax=Mycobacterium bourgelatii TaxID=1273442 RepID=A0A7I9YY85_MYCBU|nr:PE family protein [Mycobacterium bourgelatii]MCV6977307.1 PE family protein [Mycobacterium bourgelatii]GFG93578.1 PE family protein [Mycobacterium bourgelatii]
MSFVVTAPEAVTAAAGNLAGIGSTLQEAATAAAGSTTGIATAAADEVSVAISRLFSSFGAEFQAVNNQAANFHAEFVRLLNGGAAAYVNAELANARQTASALTGQVQTFLNGGGVATAETATGGAYVRLFENTSTNLRALFAAWEAYPFPMLQAVGGNWLRYSQMISYGVRSFIENFPQNLVNLPSAVQTGIQGLINFPFAQYTQQFIGQQVAFAQAFGHTFNQMMNGLWNGLPAFRTGVHTSIQQFFAGDFNASVATLGQATANLLITGFDTSNVVVTTPGDNSVLAIAKPVPLGPLADFFALLDIGGQEAQYLTNLTSVPILKQMSQNLTNVLVVSTTPSIEAEMYIPPTPPNPPTPSIPDFAAGTLSAFFGMPLVLSYAAVGAPFAGLNAFATSLESIQQALWAGNGLGALGALIDLPANTLNGYLNLATTLDVAVPVPTGLLAPLPTEILITLHLPFDGILVPPHPVTATMTFPGWVPPNPPFPPPNPVEITVFGTPFMGLVPLLVNYIPQQVALAIRPTA